MGEWISVDDRLPEAGKAVLVCGIYGKIDIAWYSDVAKTWFNTAKGSRIDRYGVVCWMPLPKPPMEG